LDPGFGIDNVLHEVIFTLNVDGSGLLTWHDHVLGGLWLRVGVGEGILDKFDCVESSRILSVLLKDSRIKLRNSLRLVLQELIFVLKLFSLLSEAFLEPFLFCSFLFCLFGWPFDWLLRSHGVYSSRIFLF
jgi:hypothetical protein